MWARFGLCHLINLHVYTPSNPNSRICPHKNRSICLTSQSLLSKHSLASPNLFFFFSTELHPIIISKAEPVHTDLFLLSLTHSQCKGVHELNWIGWDFLTKHIIVDKKNSIKSNPHYISPIQPIIQPIWVGLNQVKPMNLTNFLYYYYYYIE